MFKFILNMLFPTKCACCGTIIEDTCDIHICGKCLSKISFYRDDYIIIDDIDTIFFDRITSACKYLGVLRKSILKYKFGGSPSYCKALAICSRMTPASSIVRGPRVFNRSRSVPCARYGMTR